MNNLYNEKILALASALPHMPRLSAPDVQGQKVSRICGSHIDVDLKIEQDRVVAFGFEAHLCALGQTALSVVAQHIVGTPLDELVVLRDQMVCMLKQDGQAPAGKWADLAYLEPVKAYPPRHASTLLVFEAIVQAIETYRGKSRS